MGIGERLKRLRELHGWDRREVSNRLGMPYQTYSNYERDQRELGHKDIIRFAELFHVSTDYLLCRTNSFNLVDVLPMNNKDIEFCHELESICLQLNDKGRETLLTTARAFLNDEELKKGSSDFEDDKKQAG